jgi:membrane fusion protein (multidrug efflux system)
MFVDVEILSPSRPVVALPARRSLRAVRRPVFVVEQMKAPNGAGYRGVRQQFVKLGNNRGDQVAISSGIKPGEEVVTSGVFKLRNGAAILIDNTTPPTNNASPKPEDS